MKRSNLLLLVIALCVSGLSPAKIESAPRIDKFVRSETPIPGRYIVILNENTGERLMEPTQVELVSTELSNRYGGRIDKLFTSAIKGYSIEMSAAEAEALSHDARVKYVEEDVPIFATDTQTSPDWGLDRIDQHNLPMQGQYNYNATGTGVNAYVIDSGIRATHADFGGRVQFGFDAIGDGQNGNDCHGHGTHVAGTIGSATYGVAKNVTLHSVRVLNCSGSGSVSGVIAGVDWITANHISPAVANISLTANGPVTSLNEAITNSISAGVTYVIAAANHASDACNYAPGNTTGAITVGATGNLDQRAGYSNFGPCLDIFAPGHRITSAGIATDTATAIRSGTSMASPLVAGVAALFLETNPVASPAAVWNAINTGSTPGIVTNIASDSPNLLLFSLVAETITGVSPSGGFAYVGNPKTIAWSNVGGFDRNITIELSTDSGASYSSVIASNIPNTGSFTWMVPNMYSTQARIRVREHGFTDPSAMSSANFVISLTPTASTVMVSGMVTSSTGSGVMKATVTLIDAQGRVRTTQTGSFGNFTFKGVTAGETYIASAAHKRYQFETRVISVNDDVTDADFTAIP